MRKKEYLNEEVFQKNNKKVKTAGTIVMIIGLCLVCAAIFVLMSASKMEDAISKNSSPDVLENSSSDILENSSSDILGLFDVDSQESALSWFESTTQSMKAESEAFSAQMRAESEARSDYMDRYSLGMFMLLPGIFITLVGCMIRFIVGNQRNIMAYQAQQVMPLAQEGIEKMAPSMGIAAKEISKGIKEGMSDDNTTYCKYCGAVIDQDSNFCNKCGKQL